MRRYLTGYFINKQLEQSKVLNIRKKQYWAIYGQTAKKIWRNKTSLVSHQNSLM